VNVRIVKVGGSLLKYPQLAANLLQWRSAQPPAAEVYITGCGAFADAVRHAAAVHALDEAACHRHCLQLLAVTARILAEVAAIGVVAARLDVAKNLIQQKETPLVYDASQSWSAAPEAGFARHAPQSWEVTTDSIAAMLCRALGAGELVLLKSLPSPSDQIADAVSCGYVDPYFSQAATGIQHIRCVDLNGGAGAYQGATMQWSQQ